jgi:octaprenyl-diphosphate synthase
MKDLGENIGIAFQIRDDLLDYERTGLTGKIAGNDIKERKITLPLIHALEQASYLKKREIIGIVKSHKKTSAQIDQVINFVLENGGKEYTEMKMNQYRDKALAILDTFPGSEVRESMKTFVYYTISRQK